MPKTINPATEEIIEEYEYISREELDKKIEKADEAFKNWRLIPKFMKKDLFMKLANLMLEKKEELAELDTMEMWMLYSGALWDVKKSAEWTMYFAEHFENWLKDKEFEEWGLKWKLTYEPLGIIYTVSPWNFPFNQVFRNAVPNILAWNVVISKHASNVPKVARKIEELFLEAGFPEGVYTNLQISARESEYIISHPLVRWTNITGWDKAWRAIWTLAGQNLKPSILELGWNDPFLLLDTDDLDQAVKLAVAWRMSSCGQKCNSSKRIIVIDKLYDEFCDKYVKAFEAMKIGDPSDTDTEVWPLAKPELIEDLERQLSISVGEWAQVLTWGSVKEGEWYFFLPTVVKDVVPGMPLFDEEVFGPIAPIIKATSVEDAIELANNSIYWLASAIITDDIHKFEYVSTKLETWNAFWNKIPTSYPFLPYGWIKNSWYGKELWERGMKNFMNEKVIVY